jgi:hypothetical protein
MRHGDDAGHYVDRAITQIRVAGEAGSGLDASVPARCTKVCSRWLRDV